MISAIIVNFYTDLHVINLVENLIQEEEISEILVVDNSKSLEDTDLHKRIYGNRVKILKPQENLGYGRGVNAATEIAKNPYLLVLNPDLRLLPGCVKVLLQTTEKYNAILTGPRFYWDENKTFRLPPAEGMSLFWMWGAELASRLTNEATVFSYYWQTRHEFFWRATEPFEEIFLSGAALLLRKDFFKDEPIFDPEFFLYFEDVDLCLRVRKKGGLILCDPRAEAVHFWNQSPAPPETKQKYFFESRKIFLKKHYGLYPSDHIFSSFESDFSLKAQNLGRFSSPLRLSLSNFSCPEPLFIEISLNSWFVPFAQALIRNPWETEKIFSPIWPYLSKGQYFVRIKDQRYQRIALWYFEKV